MRTIVRRAGVAVAIAAALTLAACTPPDAPTRSPSPSATPLFSSDEEALAAAEEAYAAYLRVSDQVFADSGSGMERLETVATGELLESDRKALTEVANAGLRSVGNTSFSDITLQEVSFDESLKDVEVRVYLCEDLSAVDVLDASGASVVSQNRPDRVRYEVSMVSSKNAPLTLLVRDREVWDGGAC
jgi:hypothetical protein